LKDIGVDNYLIFHLNTPNSGLGWMHMYLH
jgi:hypothetical protein